MDASEARQGLRVVVRDAPRSGGLPAGTRCVLVAPAPDATGMWIVRHTAVGGLPVMSYVRLESLDVVVNDDQPPPASWNPVPSSEARTRRYSAARPPRSPLPEDRAEDRTNSLNDFDTAAVQRLRRRSERAIDRAREAGTAVILAEEEIRRLEEELQGKRLELAGLVTARTLADRQAASAAQALADARAGRRTPRLPAARTALAGDPVPAAPAEAPAVSAEVPAVAARFIDL